MLHKMSARSLTVIFPIYNEEKNLQATLTNAMNALCQLKLDWQMILINDGSEDCSSSLIESYAINSPNIQIDHHSKNRGYGAALRSGFELATKELVFFTDSDGQFDLHDLTKMLPYATDYDMVIGYRAMRNDPWYRKLNSLIGNFLGRILFGIHVRDINCAFKIFRRDFLDRIQTESDGALVNTEILAKARKLSCTMMEVPVNHYPRLHGTPTGANPKVIVKTFLEFFRLWRKLR